MPDLYTNGLTVSGTISYFKAFTEILTVDGDSASPVSLELTNSGSINLVTELDTRGVTLQAFTGDDTLTTSQGNDSILANDGDDVLIANDGDDTMVGGAGNDQMAGGAGADVFELIGIADGIDTFNGGTETDTLRLTGAVVSLSRLILNALASVEVIDFSTNTLTGTSGNDVFDISGVSSFVAGGTIDLGDGNDNYQGAMIGDDVLGGLGNDSLSGNDGDDTINGGDGNDSLSGGNGNDVFTLGSAGPGNDTFAGGAGNDQLVLDAGANVSIARLVLNAAASVEVLDTNGFALSGTANGDFYDLGGVLTYATPRQIDLGQGNDSFVGAAAGDDVIGGLGNDQLAGGGGNDSLQGGEGNDSLDGGTGTDTLNGSAGNDVYTADSALDQLIELADGGTDKALIGNIAGFVLAENVENAAALGTSAIALTGNALGNDLTGTAAGDTLDGGTGIDTLRGGAGNDVYIIDTLGDAIVEDANKGTDKVQTALLSYTLGLNLEQLTGTAATGQTLIGNAAANRIEAGAGNDLLNGGAGVDTMIGGAGDDAYIVDNASEHITEIAGGGSDWVETALKAYVLADEVEDLIGTSVTAGQKLTGNAVANWIETGTGMDTLDGGLGADTLRGGAGNDLYIVDDAKDRVQENASAGTDSVSTNLAKYTLAAEVENLSTSLKTGTSLTGNALANAISGNAGDDTLDGSFGKDELKGGGGADIFVFKTALDPSNVDQITDFNAAADTMKLENTGAGLFNVLAKGGLSAAEFKVIGPGGSPVDADDHILYNQSTGAVYYDADGSGAGAKVQFATLTNGAVLTAADFLIF